MQALEGCEDLAQDVFDWVTADELEEELNIEEIMNAFQETEKVDDEAVDEQPPLRCSINLYRTVTRGNPSVFSF